MFHDQCKVNICKILHYIGTFFTIKPILHKYYYWIGNISNKTGISPNIGFIVLVEICQCIAHIDILSCQYLQCIKKYAYSNFEAAFFSNECNTGPILSQYRLVNKVLYKIAISQNSIRFHNIVSNKSAYCFYDTCKFSSY